MLSEQQVREVLDMLRDSEVTNLDKIMYFNSDWDEHAVANLNSVSSTDGFIDTLKANGDIEENL